MICESNEQLQSVIQMIIEFENEDPIFVASTQDDAIEQLNTISTISVVIMNFNLEENIAATKLLQTLSTLEKKIPTLVYLKGYEGHYPELNDFKHHRPGNHLINMPIQETDLLKYVHQCQKHRPKTHEQKHDQTHFKNQTWEESRTSDYGKIRISKLEHCPLEGIDLYLKLSEDKYVKIQKAQDPFVFEILKKYQEKGQEFVYIKANEYQTCFSQIMKWLKDKISQASTIEESLNASADVLTVVTKGQKFLHIAPEQYELINTAVGSCLKNLEKNKKLKNSLEILRKEEGYLVSHSVTCLHLCYMMARKTSYYNDQILEKLSYASLLQNISLQDDHLASILDTHQNPHFSKLPIDQQKMIDQHPQQSANLVISNTVSEDVIRMIKEHHERPDGLGFPRKLKHNQINPLSSIYILAVRMADFLFHHEHNDQAIKEYLTDLHKNWKVSNFIKPVEYLNEIIELK